MGRTADDTGILTLTVTPPATLTLTVTGSTIKFCIHWPGGGGAVDLKSYWPKNVCRNTHLFL